MAVPSHTTHIILYLCLFNDFTCGKNIDPTPPPNQWANIGYISTG